MLFRSLITVIAASSGLTTPGAWRNCTRLLFRMRLSIARRRRLSSWPTRMSVSSGPTMPSRMAKAAAADLKGGDAAANAAIVGAILDGKPGAPRDVVLLNAGAALFIAGRAGDVRAGIARAAAAIDSGAARKTLETMVRVSQSGVGA